MSSKDAKPAEKPTPTLDSLSKGSAPAPTPAPAETPAPAVSGPAIGGQPVAELPRYKSHKEIRALKIKKVRTAEGALGFLELVPEDARFVPFLVSAGWAEQHKAEAGGYFVLYKDGYTSFSPAAAFEEGYTRIIEGGE